MMAESQCWWDDRVALHRYVTDLLAAELALARPGRAVAPLPWAADLPLGEGGVGADSLERVKLGTALGEAVHFARSGIEAPLLAQRTLGEWTATIARSLDAFSAELTFRTSGSTGEPKWCVHRLAELSAEIDVLAPRFAESRRIVSAVPSHHIYGFLFTILLALRLGVEAVDVRAHLPAAVAAMLRAGDLVVGHPGFWGAFTRGTPAVPLAVVGVTSTGPCPPQVARDVRSAGVERFVEIYGSSETAGIGWRDDDSAAFELFPYWRRPHDAEGLIRRCAGGGETRIEVPDRLTWDDDRHVRPAGRRDGALQVGGTNVFPEHARDVLAGHPGVAQAAVRLMRADEGSRLKAFVVPSDARADLAALRAELWTWIDRRLNAAERPKSIEFGPVLPTGAHNKPADWPISGAARD